MNNFIYYLIIINIISFLLLLISTWIPSEPMKKWLNKFLMLLALIGGVPGILLSTLLFDRKAVKGNMMLRVFSICILIIQIVLFLILKGNHGEELTFAFWEFFAKHKALLIYLGIVNVITFAAFGFDKLAAIRDRGRIKIVTLLGLCFIGGSIGGLAAMYLFRHKTNKGRNSFFTLGVPLMIVMQVLVLFYVMNL